MPYPLRLCALVLSAGGLCAAIPLTANMPGERGKPEPSRVSTEKVSREAHTTSESAPVKDLGCLNRIDNRSSDLCAQWKAADAADSSAKAAWKAVYAAESSAKAAWAAVYAGIIGLLIAAATLFYASRASLWAKKAAGHTEEGAIEARRTAAIAEATFKDARLSAEPKLWCLLGCYISVTKDGEIYPPHVNINVLNEAGSGKAYNVNIQAVKVTMPSAGVSGQRANSGIMYVAKSLEPGAALGERSYRLTGVNITKEDVASEIVVGWVVSVEFIVSYSDNINREIAFREVWEGGFEKVEGFPIRVAFERKERSWLT